MLQQLVLPAYRVATFQELARRPGIDLTVVYAGEPDLPSVKADGFSALRTPMWRGRLGRHPIYWHRAQVGYATRSTTDVLILSGDPHYASLVPALLRARLTRVPTILWTHGIATAATHVRGVTHVALAKMATALLLYNRAAARRYEQWGLSPKRLFVAPNSLDQAPTQAARRAWADPGRLDRFAREQRLGPGPVILFVSRLGPDRRVDLLLRAAKDLVVSHPGLQVVLIGEGRKLQSLHELVRSLQLDRHVRFMGAMYDQEQLAPWFLSADVFCVPDQVGLSILHAFGYGLPVVTSDHVEAHGPEFEALRHEENGLIYPHGDASGLAAALRRLFDDGGLRGRMARAAEELVQTQYTVKRMVDGMEAAVRYAHGMR